MTMDQDDAGNNRRSFSRIPFNGEVIVVGDQGRWSASLLDVSLKGVLVSRPAEWHGEQGENYQLHIGLSDGNLSICMDVMAAHICADKVGFCCTHIDLDSITHLRRLLELNIGDEDQVNKELSALLYNVCSVKPGGG